MKEMLLEFYLISGSIFNISMIIKEHSLFFMASNKFFINENGIRLSDGRVIFYLTLFSFLAFYFLLNVRPFYGSDEIRVAAISLSFDVNDNWFIGAVNGRIFLHKPPLYFWLNGIIMKLFGVNYFAIRFVSASSAALNVVITYLLARKLKFSKSSAVLGAMSLISCAQFFMTGRSIIIDVLLSLTIGVCWYAFYTLNLVLLSETKNHKKEIIWFMILMLGFAAGIMAKGLVGLVVPLSGIGIWMLWDSCFDSKKIRWALWIYLLIAVLLSFVPVAWWCYALYQNYGYEAFKEVVIDNNFGRFLGPLMNYEPDHKESLYYYIAKIHELFTPWVFFIPIMLYFYYKKLRNNFDSRIIFLLLILFVPLILLNISSGKRRLYLLPLYMPLAILFGEFVFCCFKESFRSEIIKHWFQVIFYYFTWILAFVLPIAYTVLLVVAIVKDVVGVAVLIVIGAVSLSIVLLNFFSLNQSHRFRFLLLIATNTILILVWSNDVIRTSYHTKKKSYAPLEQKLKEIQAEGHEIVLINPRERLSSAVVYFLGHNVIECLWSRKLDKLWRRKFRARIGTVEEIKNPKQCYFLMRDDVKISKKYHLVKVDNIRIGRSKLSFFKIDPSFKGKGKFKIFEGI